MVKKLATILGYAVAIPALFIGLVFILIAQILGLRIKT